ncbi:uncharacterized protein LOC121737201 [Aricia agestis]|uniref:uncharacterized protein LOC121737201 n=1 Tax=Aricia agestis TaxID=91739 RepID=UPI001C207D72|nr:uncharacterized protein LOC121737201 [Aricia agestis]
MGYDDIDDHEFIISDEENTPDEIKRPVITNIFDKEVKNNARPVTQTTTSNVLPTTLSPYKNHEKYKTSPDKDTKMSPPDSSADSDSNDESTLPAIKKREELDKSSHEQDVTSQKDLHVDSEETQKRDGIKSDDIANSELLSSTLPATKKKEELDKSSHKQDVTSQKELHVDSEETQKIDGIKSDDVMANSELISSTSPIAKENKKVHEQGVTSQEQVHVDKEGSILEDTKKEDKVQKEDPDDDEDHKKALHSGVSTESEKLVPVARNYLVNGFI